MKRNLPLHSSKRGRKPSSDTLTLLMNLGFRSEACGHWTDGRGTHIYEVGGPEQYALERAGVITHFPALIAVYQELVKGAHGATP